MSEDLQNWEDQDYGKGDLHLGKALINACFQGAGDPAVVELPEVL